MTLKSSLVTIVDVLTEEELREILAMERELFPPALQDESYEKEIKEGKIAIIAYSDEGNVAGYIFSVPHYHAYSELREIDPHMPAEDDALYIESIAIRSDFQGKGYFSKLMEKLKEVAQGRTITMHARVCNNCSKGMQKHGAMHVHRVENWFDSGEPFDYLVISNP